MPLYEYIHEETGATLEMVRPISLRDAGVPPGFKRVPTVPGVIVAHRMPNSLEENLRQGYYEREQREGSRFNPAHSIAQIKEACTPDP